MMGPGRPKKHELKWRKTVGYVFFQYTPEFTNMTGWKIPHFSIGNTATRSWVDFPAMVILASWWFPYISKILSQIESFPQG